MKSVVIIGAGGHGAVVADILLAAHDAGSSAVPVAFLDDDPERQGTSVLGIPVAGHIRDLCRVPHDAVVLAVGSNAPRARLFDELVQMGESFISACHPTATIGREVTIGAGTVVCAGVIVNSRTTIGDNVILNTGCSVDHDCTVGSHVHVAPGARLAGAVTLSAGTLVGMLAALLPGRTAGDWSTVGAGAVVTRDVEAGETVAGIPARTFGRRLDHC